MRLLWIVLASLLVLPKTVEGSVPKKWEDAARSWGPLVWLPRGETIRPSSVPFFFANPKLESQPSLSLTVENIPKCDGDCFLVTKENLNSATSKLSFFAGQPLYQAPVYAVIKQDGSRTDIYYWFFYPYNTGKRVCVGLQVRTKICGCWWSGCCKYIDECIGFKRLFGNHVGDWEHIRVKFLGDFPFAIELASHGDKREFINNGNEFVNSNGQPPLQFSGTHPIMGFLRFQGRWGNRKRDCGLYENISGECVLNNGPSTPGM